MKISTLVAQTVIDVRDIQVFFGEPKGTNFFSNICFI